VAGLGLVMTKCMINQKKGLLSTRMSKRIKRTYFLR
jgi:hypothetical protein